MPRRIREAVALNSVRNSAVIGAFTSHATRSKGVEDRSANLRHSRTGLRSQRGGNGRVRMAPPMIELLLLLVAGLGMVVFDLIAEFAFEPIFGSGSQLAGSLFGSRGFSISSSWPPGQQPLSLGPRHVRRRKGRHTTRLPFRAQQFR